MNKKHHHWRWVSNWRHQVCEKCGAKMDYIQRQSERVNYIINVEERRITMPNGDVIILNSKTKMPECPGKKEG